MLQLTTRDTDSLVAGERTPGDFVMAFLVAQGSVSLWRNRSRLCSLRRWSFRLNSDPRCPICFERWPCEFGGGFAGRVIRSATGARIAALTSPAGSCYRGVSARLTSPCESTRRSDHLPIPSPLHFFYCSSQFSHA